MAHPAHRPHNSDQPPNQRILKSNTIMILVLIALILTVIASYYWGT